MTGHDAAVTVLPRTRAVAGIGITMCALTATGAAILAVHTVSEYIGWFGWMTIPAIWPLLAGCVLAGMVLIVRPEHGDIAAVGAFVCAAQLIGGGIAASRDWFNVSGATGFFIRELAVILPLTAVVIVASTVTACVALTLVGQHATAARASGWRPPKPMLVLVGGALAVTLPIAFAMLTDSSELTGLGQMALTWSLPWGISLALAGWLEQRSRRTALSAVLFSALATVAIPLVMLLQ